MVIIESILDQLDNQQNTIPTDSSVSHNREDYEWRMEVQFPDAEKFPKVFESAKQCVLGIFEAFHEITEYYMDDECHIPKFIKERESEYMWFGVNFNIVDGTSIQKIYNRLVFPLSQLAINIRKVTFYFANKERDYQEYGVCISDIDAIYLTGIKSGQVHYFQQTTQSLFYIFRFFAYMATGHMCSPNVFDTKLGSNECYYDLLFPTIFNPEWKKFWRSLPRENGMRVISADTIGFILKETTQLPEFKLTIYAYNIEEMTVKMQALKLMLDILGLKRLASYDILQKSYATRQRLFTNQLFENVEPIGKVVILFPAFENVLKIYDNNFKDIWGCLKEMKRVLEYEHNISC